LPVPGAALPLPLFPRPAPPVPPVVEVLPELVCVVADEVVDGVDVVTVLLELELVLEVVVVGVVVDVVELVVVLLGGALLVSLLVLLEVSALVVAVAVVVGHCLAVSCESVVAPWFRFDVRVALTEPGSASTAVLNAVAALMAVAHCFDPRAEDTWSS
jgi:hypothetical protein